MFFDALGGLGACFCEAFATPDLDQLIGAATGNAAFGFHDFLPSGGMPMGQAVEVLTGCAPKGLLRPAGAATPPGKCHHDSDRLDVVVVLVGAAVEPLHCLYFRFLGSRSSATRLRR